MISTQDMSRFIRDLDRAARDTPEALRNFQLDLATKYFEKLQANAPPDREGRLMASFQRRSGGYGKEWVEKHTKGAVEVGTKVYYAPMVNDGHVIGTRIGNSAHAKIDARDRQEAARKAKRGWVSGRFFREAAEADVDVEIPALADRFADDALREVMR